MAPPAPPPVVPPFLLASQRRYSYHHGSRIRGTAGGGSEANPAGAIPPPSWWYPAPPFITTSSWADIDTGDLVAGITPKGSPVDPFIGIVPTLGNTVPVPKGKTEWAVKIGKEVYHEFLVELKNT